jgi:penicillin-binding protein A
MKKSLAVLLVLCVSVSFILYKNSKSYISNEEIKDIISQNYFKGSSNSEKGSVYIKGKQVEYKLTINEDLQSYIRKILSRFKTPFSAVAVIDNETSQVLALVGYNHKYKKQYDELALSTTNPGASLSKIISSAALLETGKVHGSSYIFYNGKGTTLYKNQLKNKKNRWTRKVSFMRSFSYSNNVSFGKLAQKHLNPRLLLRMANNFGFNSEILNIIHSPVSSFELATSKYQLAEFGSGFNKVNTISPLHAAYLSTIVANNGVRQGLRLVKGVYIDGEELDMKKRKLLSDKRYKIYSSKTASEMKAFMLETVRRGTARGVGQLLKRSLKKKLLIGAKTGSITGGFPEGKREWVSAFAKPKDKRKGYGISVAVINILDKKWYVRSSYIAKKIIEHYFSSIKKI